MDAADLDKKRTCRACPKIFQIKRINQFYCSAKCRHREKERRKVERRRMIATPPSGIDLHRRILELQTQRDKNYIPRLRRDPYLTARAEVVEAEQQLKRWHERLKQRTEALRQMYEPFLNRVVEVVTENKPLRAPSNASSYGACSTDGLLGVVVYGSIFEIKKTDNS